MANQIPDNMSLSIDHDKRRITMVQTGEINKENSLLLSKLINQAEGFDPTYTSLIDYRGLSRVSFSAAEIAEVARELIKTDKRVAKIGLVIGDQIGRFLLAKLFTELGRALSTPYTYKAFRTIHEAEAWLDIDA